MADATNYLKRVQLAYSVGQATYAMPTGTVIALFLTSPTNSGGGIEVSGGAYVRQPIIWGPPITDGGGNTTIENTTTIIFSTATAGWGTVVAGAIFDLAGSPNMLYWGPLTPQKTILQNDSFQILPNNIVIGGGASTVSLTPVSAQLRREIDHHRATAYITGNIVRNT